MTRCRNVSGSACICSTVWASPCVSWILRPIEPAHELDVMVAQHCQRLPRLDHGHGDAQDFDRSRPTIDEIADEDGAPPRRCLDDRVATAYSAPVPSLGEQHLELVAAAVHVADNVERACLVALVRRSAAVDVGILGGRNVRHEALETLKAARHWAAVGPVHQLDGVDDRQLRAETDLGDAAEIAGGDEVGPYALDVARPCASRSSPASSGWRIL